MHDKPVIFISHVNEEQDLAGLIEACLNAALPGAEVYRSSAPGSVRAGTAWMTSLEGALERTRIALALCSPIAIQRDWVHFEVGASFARGAAVVPICHTGMNVEQLLPPLSFFQGISLQSPSDWSALLEACASAVGQPLGAVDLEAYDEGLRAFEGRFSQLGLRERAEAAQGEIWRRQAGSSVARHRDEAAQVLTAFGDTAAIEPLVQALREQLAAGDSEGACLSISNLSIFGEKARAAIPALGEAVGGADENVRVMAIDALGQMGQDAVPVLRDHLRSSEADVRVCIVDALADMGGPAALEVLREALGHPDPAVREDAVEALAGIGAAAVPILREAARSADEDVRDAARAALDELDS